jgi:hypothetical protein
MGGYPNTPNTTGGGLPSPSGGSIIGPLIGAAAQWGKDAWSNKKQRELEAKRRKYDLEQWQRQNAYNHPTEQMKRLLDAGLNPNLIYGSSPGSAVGNAGAIPAGQAPSYSLDNPVTGFMNTKVQQAQSNNLNTAAMKNIASANLSDSQTNKLNSLLASEVTMAEEGAKQSITNTFLKDLEKTGKDKHYLANMAAQTKKAIQEGEAAEAKKLLVQFDADLTKQGIRPGDKQWISLMARIFDIDISNMINPRKEVLDIFQYYKLKGIGL